MQTELPFLRMKLICKKLDRKTSSSFLTILKAPRPWPGLMNIANIIKVQIIKRKQHTISPMQIELPTCRSKLPSGTQGFKKPYKKTLCPLQNAQATPRWGRPRHQTFKTCLERMYGCRRSCKINEMQIELPFLRMKLTWKKLDRNTSSSFLSFLKAPRPWPGLMNIANIIKVQRIKLKQLTLSPMQMELPTCRSKLPSGTYEFKTI